MNLVSDPGFSGNIDGRRHEKYPYVSFGRSTAEQRIQRLNDHPRDGVAVFIGILLGSFGQSAWNVDDDLLSIISACVNNIFVCHRDSLSAE